MQISEELIYKIVKQVLEKEQPPQGESAFEKHVDSSGVISIKTETVKCEPFDVGVPAKVSLKDVVTLEESPRLGCGILEIDHSTYPWTLTYDEFYYVVEGVLDIIIEGRHNVGNQGDILHVPKGSSVCFSSPKTCRAVYFTYPADWAAKEE
ncbi:MAG: cupin domain-containing protein [Emergencia sp.]|nr:cupin domain-containing protein [Emergencia sp.]